MSYTSKEVYEFISTQNSDPILERKVCTVSGQNFPVFQSDLDFYNKISPTFAGQRFQIPTPTLCPEERSRRRLSFRNERKLYKRKCDASGDTIISIYSPDKAYKVYNQDFRWSDRRDSQSYQTAYHHAESFFEQFKKLNIAMPKRALVKGTGSENCDYVNGVGASKNCYFIFDSSDNSDCFFGNTIVSCNNCCDMSVTKNSEHCYELIDCINCYTVSYSQNSINCQYSKFLLECNNCEFCFACVGLAHKKYCIFNKQHTKEEYEQQIKTIAGQYLRSDFLDFSKHFPLLASKIINCERGRGNMIYGSSDIINSFEISDSQHIAYSSVVFNQSHDNYDTYVCINNSCQNYEGLILNKNCSHLLFCMDCRNNCSNLLYCMECKRCKNCFGCTGLVDREYCILNKQYTQSEYEDTVASIISHMQETGERGEFFHPSLSAFGYNETAAQEQLPRSSREAKKYGYQRQDNNYDPTIPMGAKVINRQQTENEPQEDEPILKSIFVCETSERPYRIIKQELDFYRKHNLPLPKKHPDIRHEERMKLRPERTLYLRKCDCCGKEMLSVYQNSQKTSEQTALNNSKQPDNLIYCELCYQKEVYV